MKHFTQVRGFIACFSKNPEFRSGGVLSLEFGKSHVEIFTKRPVFMTGFFCGFPKFFQADAEITPSQILPRAFPFASFPSRYSLTRDTGRGIRVCDADGGRA